MTIDIMCFILLGKCYLCGAQQEELQIQTYSLSMPPRVVNNLRGRGISGRF